MRNWVTIERNGRDLAEIIAWAKIHCPTYITNGYGIVGGRTSAYDSGEYDANTVDYFFGNNAQGQRDMILFALKWL